MPATSVPARDSSLAQAQSTSDPHHGRDAALAGGLVGAGGTYAATRDHSSSTTAIVGQQVGSSNTTGLPGATSTTAQTQLGQEHHYDRDAALGAGAGAVGYGAYEATQGRGESI